jgi:hypothetical protein
VNQSGTAVLLLGDASALEMQPVVEFVMRQGSAVDIRQSSNVAEVRRLAVDDQWFPELIVALQSWPDEFSISDVRTLMSLAPLARIVCVCGVWCDSEGRTHLNWPLAIRARVSTAVDRIQRELATVRGETTPLPLTAGRGEIFAADFTFACEAKPHSMPVAVVSSDRRWKEMLCAGLVQGGRPVVTLENSNSPAAIIWDGDPWDSVRLAELRSLRRTYQTSMIVACAGFPRDGLADEIRDGGADAVWFKLAPLATLLSQLDAQAAVS